MIKPNYMLQNKKKNATIKLLCNIYEEKEKYFVHCSKFEYQ